MLKSNSEDKCLCCKFRQRLACLWKSLQQEIISNWDVSILQKYKNSPFRSPQTPVVRHITLLNWNARLSLCKLLLLLIFPFPTLKMTCNSDILQSAGAYRRYSSIQMQRLQWEAGRKLLRLSIFVIFYNHHNMTWYVQLFSPSLLQGNIIFRLRRPSWRMKLFTRVKWASPRAARQSFPVRPGSTFWVSATTESVNAGYLGAYKHACSLSEYPNVVL